MVAEMPFCVVVFCCIHVSPVHKIHFTGAQWGQILSRRTSQPADLPSRGWGQCWLFSNAGSNPWQTRKRGPEAGDVICQRTSQALRPTFLIPSPKPFLPYNPMARGPTTLVD